MSADGMWYVKLADGDVERMTLDQLDAAFQDGQVDENSMVLAEGADGWMKLSELLGLSEEEALTPVPAPPPAAPQHMASMPPLRRDADRAGPPPLIVQLPASVLQAEPAGLAIAARASVGGPLSPMMPSTAPTASLRPVSVDLGAYADPAELQFRSSSRKRWVVGMLGTALVLGAGVFFMVPKLGLNAHADPAPVFAAAAAVPPPAPVTPPASPAVAEPPAQPANAGPSSVMDPTRVDPAQRQTLTDDQKRRALEADKSAKLHAKTHAAGAGVGHASHPKEKSSSAFTTSGNKYDPLNSSL